MLIIIGLIAVVAAIFGLVGMCNAAGKHQEAKKLQQLACQVFQEAKTKLQQAHDETAKTLNALGQLKLDVWSEQVGRFAELFEWLKDVEITGTAQVGELQRIKEELAEIRQIAFNAGEIAQGGAAALGAGALAGIATYGGATMLASASTGTAIATLSGAAATNATLAWFGGGSLAAGGLGMAGGMCVLGGIIAAPVLAVGGLVLEAKARKILAQAQENYAIAQKSAGELDNARTITRAIQKAAIICHNTIEELQNRVDCLLDEFEEILKATLHQNETASKKLKMNWRARFLWWFGIGRPKKFKTLNAVPNNGRKISFDSMPENYKRRIHFVVEAVYFLKQLLEVPLLDNAGALKNDYQKLIEKSKLYIPDVDS